MPIIYHVMNISLMPACGTLSDFQEGLSKIGFKVMFKRCPVML